MKCGPDQSRLPRAVGTNHNGDPGGKFKSGFVSEALEATELKGFEHPDLPSFKSKKFQLDYSRFSLENQSFILLHFDFSGSIFSV